MYRHNQDANMPEQDDSASAIRSIGHAVDSAGAKVEKAAMFGINSTIIRTIMQGGFALLVGYLFYDQSRSQKEMVTNLMGNTELRHIESEKMFREEIREQRKSHWESTKMLREGMDGVKRAVEVNTEAVKQAGEKAAQSAAEIKRILKDNGGDCPPISGKP